MKREPTGVLSGWTGNPLFWSNADKLIVFGVIFLLPNIPILAILYKLRQNPVYLPDIMTQSSFVFYVQVISVLFLIAWLPVLLRQRITNPNGLWFVYMLYPVAIIHDTIFISWYGYATTPFTFLVMLSFPFVAYLFFNLGVAAVTLSAFILTLGSFMAAEAAGMIPYAPGLRSQPVIDGAIDPAWLWTTLSIGLFITCAMFALTGLLISRWRERETEVTRMSEMLKDMFGRYMSTEVMQELIDNPDSHLSVGERREATVLMTDIRGFTAISERLSPEQVVRVLNNYVGIMVDVCKKYNGTVNDIIGDALLVTFGAPVRMEGHALAAVACAVEMQNAMADVNLANASAGLPHIAMGIGIHTDEVVVGNIGSEERAKFTVIGSGVNMANRIESFTVGGQVLISDSVKGMSGDSLRVDRRLELFPKGAENPITVYDIGGVGVPYNLVLMKPKEQRLRLHRMMHVGIVLLEGKHMGGQEHEGDFMDISLIDGRLKTEMKMEPLSNLKIRLLSVSEDLAHICFYGKSMDKDEQGNYIIKFTAMPTEINAYIQATLLYATGTP